MNIQQPHFEEKQDLEYLLFTNALGEPIAEGNAAVEIPIGGFSEEICINVVDGSAFKKIVEFKLHADNRYQMKIIGDKETVIGNTKACFQIGIPNTLSPTHFYTLFETSEAGPP